SVGGQEILRGKHVREGGVSPRDWMHFILSLLCHDIGYVRGVCREDRNSVYTTGMTTRLCRCLPERAMPRSRLIMWTVASASCASALGSMVRSSMGGLVRSVG